MSPEMVAFCSLIFLESSPVSASIIVLSSSFTVRERCLPVFTVFNDPGGFKKEQGCLY